ncbi:MAG: IclR family transcriptional regulator [Burkholderiales bacterium]|nr:MAG: IclR family transcriptional regulator [Burkholderiales bacterium]
MAKRRQGAPAESIALRAFAVLEEVVRAAAPMSLDEVTYACGLPKPTTFRILSLLQSADLLRREPLTKRYTVGPRLTAFALDLWRQSTLRVQWHRALEEAVEEIGESCNLTILEGDKVLYLDRVETRRPLRLHLEPGTRVPLHCTASGKLFLCQMSREQVRRLLGPEPLVSHTRRTITRYVNLYEELEKVLTTQVGTHDCELFDDSVAIAAPIADPAGYVYAAVAVHAPSSRESIESCMRHLPALRKAAARIAATMTPPPTGLPSDKPRTTVRRPRPTVHRAEKAASESTVDARHGSASVTRAARPTRGG